MKIWLDGKIVTEAEGRVSVFDHGLLYGDGVFEGLRFYHGKIFRCREHLLRLEQSAKAIRLKLPYSPAELEKAMYECIQAEGVAEGYIRLVCTRGAGSLGVSPATTRHPVVFIIVDVLKMYPLELYENGMPVIISSVARNHPNSLSPRIKSLNYLNNVLAKLEALDAGVHEAIMLNTEGYVAEATGDNVFIVRQGELQTPPPHAGILEGITRGAVIECAKRLSIPFAEKMLTRHDLYVADECFLTGTGAEVIGVSVIDGRPVGPAGITTPQGVGPLTRKLLAEFRRMVAEE